MNKVCCCADLHGHYEVYKRIKAMLDPTDRVYCLGDCGDRGPEPWRTIKAVYDDPQWIYLKGNHEDMLINAINRKNSACNLLFSNGGRKTYEAAMEDPEVEEYITNLSRLPQEAVYINRNRQTIHLSHAGMHPEQNVDYLWDRDHFYYPWHESFDPNLIIVHGHTPTPYIHNVVDDYKTLGDTLAVRYCNGHKIDIDCGGFFTTEWCLLNLDTLEAISIYGVIDV